MSADKKTILQKLKDAAEWVVGLEVEDAEVVAPVELAQEKLENGTVLEAEEFVVGAEVFIVSEDERVALPVGDYELADGRMLSVEEEGVIATVGEAQEEEPEAEPEQEMEEAPEYVTKDEFNEAIEQIKKSLLSKVEQLDGEKKELEAEKTALQKEIDAQPVEEPIKHKPKVELKQTPASTKKGRLYQFLNSKK
jgi:hypothetical protein